MKLHVNAKERPRRLRSAPQTAPLYLSQVLGAPILDAQGGKVARLRDLVVRFGSHPHPAVSGLVARQGRRDFYLSWARVADFSPAGVRLDTFTVDLRPFERRESEALLRLDILDKQLIDVDGRRLVRANDLRLARVDREYRLVGVDVSARGLWRRLGPASMTREVESPELLDWAEVESFATDTPMVRLKAPLAGLAKLHPVEIARIVEEVSYHQGQEILASLDDETAADTVQELEPEEAADLLELMEPERAADILEEMEPDDAADLLAEMSEEDSSELLGLMEPEESDDVRELLAYAAAYEPDSAAGLMTNDFVTVAPDLTVERCLQGLRQIPDPPDPLYHVYLVEEGPEPERQRLLGAVSVRDLLFADPSTPLADLAETGLPVAALADEARDVARTMAEYNLTDIPVVDEEGCVLGIVLVDDAIEALHPGLLRRFLTDTFS